MKYDMLSASIEIKGLHIEEHVTKGTVNKTPQLQYGIRKFKKFRIAENLPEEEKKFLIGLALSYAAQAAEDFIEDYLLKGEFSGSVFEEDGSVRFVSNIKK